MTCYHPLKAFCVGVNPETGNSVYKITSHDVDFIYKRLSDVPPVGSDHITLKSKWSTGSFSSQDHKILDTCTNSSYISNYRNSFVNEQFMLGYKAICDYIDIPCGQCIGCRLKRSKDWAIRCCLESKYFQSNSFITLTYNDDHLPDCNDMINDDGEIVPSPIHPLKIKDLQDFFKRLRRHMEYHNFPCHFKTITTHDSDGNLIEREVKYYFRYFACGEYGPSTMRPHYHLILFGFKPDDLILHKRNHLGQPVFRSPLLEKIWHKGYVTVGDLTFESAAYVSRYITKKVLGENSYIYENYNFTPEFCTMSRCPGIASFYFEDNSNLIYKSDKIYISRGLDDAIFCHPP